MRQMCTLGLHRSQLPPSLDGGKIDILLSMAAIEFRGITKRPPLSILGIKPIMNNFL
jgi:hypothetical protein